MEITSLADALHFIPFASAMREDLPDGQWEELKETILPFFRQYGRDAGKWPDDVAAEFVAEVNSNALSWL